MARTFSPAWLNRQPGPHGGATPLTYSGWIRPTSFNPAYSYLFDAASLATNAEYGLFLNDGGALFCIHHDGSAAASPYVLPAVTLNTWNYVAVVFAATNSRTLYSNGAASTDTTNVPGAMPAMDVFSLGARRALSYVNTSLYSGDMAEVGIWAAALTAEEIAALQKGVTPLMVRPSSLMAYYPLRGETIGAVEFDRWSRGQNLTNANGNPPKAEHPRIYVPWHTSIEAAGTAAINFQAAAAFSVAATAVLTTGIHIAAAAAFTVAASATLSAGAPALAASPTIQIGTTASLALQPRLSGAAGVRFATAASFLPPTINGAAGFFFSTRATMVPSPRETQAGITINGEDVRGRVRMKGLTIHDILNDAPNTCSLVIEGTEPLVGQSLRITLNEGARVLFSGEIQTVNEYFELQPANVAWQITGIDDTARANARRPFGTFVDQSASAIANAISIQCAPGFSRAGIAPDLPTVRIVFDGADTFIAALSRLATAIGGYCKVEDRTVYLFQEDTETTPDPIDGTHCFMHDPPIHAIVDESQLRTRVYGKGYGEAIQADLAAGESLVPIENGSQFPEAGQAIASVSADGAQSERLTYTGKASEAGGTLVGPGAAPTTPPGVSLAAGTGVESGQHDYAVVFVTASGRTLPGPRAPITVGQVANPPSAPTANPAVAGPGPDAGTHRYYAVFRTASGATLPGPASNAVTTGGQVEGPSNPGSPSGIEGTGLTLGGSYLYRVTYRRVSDGAETAASMAVSVMLFPSNPTYQCVGLKAYPAPPAGYVMVIYRTGVNEPDTPLTNYREIQTPTLEGPFPDGYQYWVDHNESRKAKQLPSGNGTAIASVPLSLIPSYPSALVTHVDLYREFNNAGASTARLALSVTNGTTSATDTKANGALGALVPATNTAIGNRVNVTWPPGPAGVTNVELFRTPLGSTQLKKFFSAAGNAGGSTIDSTPDVDLTTNAPTGDTSGLTQPSGQVNPGSAFLPVASPAPFRLDGGWVTLAGGQVVRYTGISGQTLTGVPTEGAGAITTTVIYGSAAIPTPMLIGVSGITRALQKGSAIHLWVQRDDLQAQAEHAARTGGDGIVEYLIVDMRRGLASLTERCDAELAMFARPLVTVTYATRDLKTKSGKLVTVDLASPAIHEVLTIQDVTITDIDIVPFLAPRFTVSASSVRFTLEDTLRRLISGGLIVGGSS